MAIRVFLGSVLAIGFLNALLTLQNVWPTPWVHATTEMSIEIAVIVLAGALFAEFRGIPGKAWRRTAITILFLLVIGRYADITAPALFGRRIDLYWDAQHLPAVAAMIAKSAPAWQTAALVAGLVTGTAVLLLAIRFSVTALLGAYRLPGLRRGIAAVAGLAVVIYAANMAGMPTGTKYWFALPVTPVYANQAKFLLRAGQANAAPVTALPESDLARAGNGDVYALFIESYGAVTRDRPEMRAALQEDYDRLNTTLSATGWQAVSAFVDSPTFGGASWLAHATLLSGNWIAEQSDYRLFLTAPPESLVDRFRTAGYRTVALFPGIKLEWPEGAAMGFDTVMTAKDMAYDGPAFGWWTIPDQASLETFHRNEVAGGARKPLFLTFASIMSHMPFGPTPPYQPDWARISGKAPFDTTESAAALALEPDWNNLAPAYLRAIRYSLRTLGGFLENRVPDDALIIVLGDHQPPAAVSGKDASRAVPVHVFSKNAAILDAFATAGFEPGLQPAPPALMRMDALNHLLLRSLDSGPQLAGAPRR